MVKRIAVLTSGGDAPGMNAAIRAVTRTGIYHGLEVYGVEHGYAGLMDGQFVPLTLHSVAGIIQHGGTMLKTARSDKFKTADGFNQAVGSLQRMSIEMLVVIGGDGSMAGAVKLSQAGIATMVVPGTIDNDMPGTKYTIGFDTALNTVLEAVNKIRDTAASHERVAVVEVMGRSAGHIALMAGLACGAEVMLLPEKPYDIRDICAGLDKSYKRGKLYSIILVAEGAAKGYDIADQIAVSTPFKPHVTVLGYIQRGGSPSAFDNIMGSRMGARAVEAYIAGSKDQLIAFEHGDILTKDYHAALSERKGIDYAIVDLAGILSM